jgi:hypothetical protein
MVAWSLGALTGTSTGWDVRTTRELRDVGRTRRLLWKLRKLESPRDVRVVYVLAVAHIPAVRPRRLPKADQTKLIWVTHLFFLPQLSVQEIAFV